MKKKLTIIKVGGKIFEDKVLLQKFAKSVTAIEGAKVVVHGGGTSATSLSKKLGIKTEMWNGRRITDAETMEVVSMTFSSLNKKMVAQLSALKQPALGITGADMNMLPANKRNHPEVDFGFVGDIIQEKVDTSWLYPLLNDGAIPVISSMTVQENGDLLNTNADSVALAMAISFTPLWDTKLTYCFDHKGLLLDINQPKDYLKKTTKSEINKLIDKGIISGGMLPKIHNALSAIENNIKVNITSFEDLEGGTQIELA